jgi:hypothetical protein
MKSVCRAVRTAFREWIEQHRKDLRESLKEEREDWRVAIALTACAIKAGCSRAYSWLRVAASL